MLGKQENSIELKCTEQVFPEFPNLLFGTQIDSSISYFDATLYLFKQGSEKYIKDFFVQYRTQIKALCDAYEISDDDAVKINEKGHYLIDGNLVYLFISFVEPNFLAYMCDRTHEIMTRGFAVSDSFLLETAKNRLTKEVLNSVFANESKNK